MAKVAKMNMPNAHVNGNELFLGRRITICSCGHIIYHCLCLIIGELKLVLDSLALRSTVKQYVILVALACDREKGNSFEKIPDVVVFLAEEAAS